MNYKTLSPVEAMQYAVQQFHFLERDMSAGEFDINDTGQHLFASVMVQDIQSAVPNQVTYMNDWGCEKLGHSLEEIQAMGSAYYDRFFVPEQMASFQHGIINYLQAKDYHQSLHFYQQVKMRSGNEMDWYFTMCKFFTPEERHAHPTRLLVVSCPVAENEQIRKQLSHLVQQNMYKSQYFIQFQSLSKREKEIVALLAEGFSAKEIANQLFISVFTVETHRKNIRKKLEINSFAGLIKFALAFDLITY